MNNEISPKGEKQVVFLYVISIIFVTYKRPSKIFTVREGESMLKYSWPYLLITILLGWWGIPWGPIYSFQAIHSAFIGYDLENLRTTK